MKRRHRPSICEAPGCREEIRRGRLMCRPHWFALPYHLRREITAAWKDGRIREWSALCLQARGLAAIDATPPRTRTATPQQAFDMQARMLGERNDP